MNPYKAGVYQRRNNKKILVNSDRGLLNAILRRGLTPVQAAIIVAAEQAIPEQHTLNQIFKTHKVRLTVPKKRTTKSEAPKVNYMKWVKTYKAAHPTQKFSRQDLSTIWHTLPKSGATRVHYMKWVKAYKAAHPTQKFSRQDLSTIWHTLTTDEAKHEGYGRAQARQYYY
jgi:hypothetical protein